MKKGLFKVVPVFLMVLCLFVEAQAAAITVDGSSSDWKDIPAAGKDSDDVSNPNTDLKSAYVTGDSDYLYLRVDVYGKVDPSSCWYYVYLDTDQDPSTGFNAGGWKMGADYRIYIDKGVSCIQKFMGTEQGQDVWGWGQEANGAQTIKIAYKAEVLECVVSRKDIKETNASEATDIMWASWAESFDSIPDPTEKPVTYNYSSK